MERPLAERIGAEVNWSAKVQPCWTCDDVPGWAFSAGSYPGALSYFEAALGEPLPGPRMKSRVIILFQDARRSDKFELAAPEEDVRTLGPGRQRYFCLTECAWRALGLDAKLGSETPCWPTTETAPRYLARYLGANHSWSYDGMLAWFLWWLRPADAYITNVAKCCAMGKGEVFRRCARTHLSRELAAFGPDLVVSFTSLVQDRHVLASRTEATVPEDQVVLSLYHPSVRSRQQKTERLVAQVEAQRLGLERLGYDVDDLLSRWAADVAWVG